MHALVTAEYGPPQGYKVAVFPKPEILRPDDILIKVHAASINPIDVNLAAGAGRDVFPLEMPFRLGCDVSGTIVAVGADAASDLQPGTEVYSKVPESHRGTVSEFCLSPAGSTAIKPRSLSHVEAASIPLASLTALQALDIAERILEGGLRGKTVYIPGGLSGVGAMSVQLAKKVFHAGRIVTTLSPVKIEESQRFLGTDILDHIIDYTHQEPAEVIEPGSVDFMFDTMGQDFESLKLMKKGGLIVSVYGMRSGEGLQKMLPRTPDSVKDAINAEAAALRLRASKSNVDWMFIFMEDSARDLDRLREWIDARLVRPLIGRVAHFNHLESVVAGCSEVYRGKGGVGKFVIEIQGEEQS